MSAYSDTAVRESGGRNAAEALETAWLGRELALFLRNAPDAKAVSDRSGRIRFVNAPLTRLFGYPELALLERKLTDLVADRAGSPAEQGLAGLRQGLDPNSGRALLKIDGLHCDGRRFPVEIAVTPLDEVEEGLAVWSFRASRGLERDLDLAARSEARLNEAQRIAKIGSWEWDVAADQHWWSDELYRMLGIDPSSGERFYDLFIERIHPDDRAAFEEASERVRRTGQPTPIDVRIVMPDGTEKIVQSQGDVVLDADGEPVRMFGTLQDITERKRVEAQLLLSTSRYQEAQRIAKIGNWEWDLASGGNWWSDELYSILEEEPSSYAASFENFLAKVHPEDRQALIDATANVDVQPATYDPAEFRLRFEDGRQKIVEVRVDVRRDERQQPVVVSGTLRDVTERIELEARLRESETRYMSTVELAAMGIAHVDREGKFIWANQHLCEMLGYTREELLSRSIKEISHEEDRDVSDLGRRDLHAGRINGFTIEKRYLRKDGSTVWVRITSSIRRDAAGKLLYDIAAVEDISDRRAAEARIQYLATHDEMTDLPNRGSFNEMASRAIEAARATGRKCAVLFIDLDRFKIINDSLGHEAGDLLLMEMSARLRACMRDTDIVARLGGDEFVVLLQDLPSPTSAADMAKRILTAILQPIDILGQECRVTASIGVATYPDDGPDAAALMKHADMAMYMAKEEGKNNYQIYSPRNTPLSVEHLVIESHLGRALEQNEFSVQYQPQVSLRTGRIGGAEALLRWWNAELGTVTPGQFIPLAEDTGLIVPIGRWILRAACEQNMAWQRQGLPPIVMAVNLSPRQFKDVSLLDDIADILEETGMAPELLELEITESVIMHDASRAADRVAAIKQLGVRLAIDDFGTGYSSLSQLKRFPIDTLKVDRSFVRDLPSNAEDKAITEAILSLAKTLGVAVVAEGVETAEQCEFLRAHGCDDMQGYYFSKPVHPDAFAALLARHETRPAVEAAAGSASH